MNLSLNEIEALSKRAARGAGLSWGLSEEAAKATRWLASHDLPGVALLADLLQQNDGIASRDLAPQSLEGVWKASAGALCPLCTGATLNDCAEALKAGEAIEMASLSHPLLLTPFAAWAAIHLDAPVAVTWQDIRVESDGYGIWTHEPHNQIGATTPTRVTVAPAAPRDDPATLPQNRGTADEAAWKTLGTFAHRTYAPATEESRILGAGAGTSDND